VYVVVVILRKIRESREKGCAIFYTDETWVFSGMKKKKEWIDREIKGFIVR
jgi:hypothetical protein